jgi:hypothetical protein
LASFTQSLCAVALVSATTRSNKALLASLQKVFRPAIVQVLRDPLAAAQLGDAVLAAKAFQNDADLLLGRLLLARRPADVLDDLLSRIFRQIRMLSHLRSCERYDEPETLPSSIPLICLMSADGGQASLPSRSAPLRTDVAFLYTQLNE